jgi:uncharacterized protein (DUF1501 family)
MSQTRRDFLRKSGCAALSMTALATTVRHFGLIDALAQKGSGDGGAYKALVCIFLDGGNDGNNTVVPNYTAGYDQYFAARGAQGMAIPRASLLPITPPSIGLDFGLHPSMPELKTLWDQQKFAIVTNVGTLVQPLTRAQYQSGAPRPTQLFSHSDQTRQNRSAVSSYVATTGWGGRTADRTLGLNPGAAIPAITSVAGSTLFTTGSQTTPLVVAASPTPLNLVLTLNGFNNALSEDVIRRARMDQIRAMDQSQTLVRAASDLTAQAIAVSDELSTDPVLTAVFPNTTLGNQLKQVAKLMKFRTQLGMSRQIFYLQLGGFDTHTTQLSRQVTLLSQVSQALKAFYDETVAQGIADDVTTFTLSDFSRTLNPAGTGSGSGSDHAWGNHAFVVGGAVHGGNFYGMPGPNGTVFPTLVNGGPDDTDTRGRFIPTTSVEMFAATLARWYGVSSADIPLVFPFINNFPTSDLGFMI